MSISIENFVKTIYLQEQHIKGDTRPSNLSKLLNISNAATTDMARSLSQKKLVNYEKYQKLSLTPEGEALALMVIRKHRLWETFLHETLKLSLLEIHEEAEKLEHSTSDFLIDKIDEFLQYPTSDPHGDPIPCSRGSITFIEDSIILSEAEIDKDYVIVRLFSSDPVFFDFCASNDIVLGASIRMEKDFEKMKMKEYKINEKTILLNKEITNIIYVKQK